LEGATRGPWLWLESEGDEDSTVWTEGEHTDNGYGFQVAVDLRRGDARFIGEARQLVPELIAEVERLHSWDGLMSLLDEHYPEDIFPTMDDREDRDPGPRIISLLRALDKAKKHGSGES
jgi:hypothetical protein